MLFDRFNLSESNGLHERRIGRFRCLYLIDFNKFHFRKIPIESWI